jgi:hypothetical protein
MQLRFGAMVHVPARQHRASRRCSGLPFDDDAVREELIPLNLAVGIDP